MSNTFQRRMKQWRMQKTNVVFVKLLLQLLFIGSELITQRFQHSRRTAERTHAVIAMFYYFVTKTGDHKRACGRNIKRIFSVAACSANVNGLAGFEFYRKCQFEQGLTKSDQFIQLQTTVLKCGH